MFIDVITESCKLNLISLETKPLAMDLVSPGKKVWKMSHVGAEERHTPTVEGKGLGVMRAS